MATKIVPLEEEHLDQIFAWMQAEDLREFLGTVFPVHRAGHLEWYRRLCADKASASYSIIADRQVPVGAIGLRGIDLVYRVAEVWIYLGEESSRGRGLGTEALSELLRFAFDTLCLHRVFATVFSFNERGRRFFAKAGFVEEGILREAAYKRGRYVDRHLFGILAGEFRRKS